MAHSRQRLIVENIIKRLKLWPAIGLVGARQTGKSTILRDVIAPHIHARYETFDSPTTLQRATTSPEAFTIIGAKDRPLIIDEVQKCPAIFDTVKLHIDRERVPGRFILSGSSEFSTKAGIYESLTGRAAVTQLFPLTPTELWKISLNTYFLHEKFSDAKISLINFDKTVDRGGMPGLCFLRSDAEFDDACLQWLETTCYRDLQRIAAKKNVDGALAFEILGEVARQAVPTAAAISKYLRRDSRVVTRYLDMFQTIFVVASLKPHPAGLGATEYVLLDSGIVNFFGGSRTNRLRAHVLNSARAYAGAAGMAMPALMYYRNAKTARIPIVLKWALTKSSPKSIAVEFEETERLTIRDFSSLISFRKKIEQPERMRCIFLSNTAKSYNDAVEVHPLRG